MHSRGCDQVVLLSFDGKSKELPCRESTSINDLNQGTEKTSNKKRSSTFKRLDMQYN
jgi:hypothetical protein